MNDVDSAKYSQSRVGDLVMRRCLVISILALAAMVLPQCGSEPNEPGDKLKTKISGIAYVLDGVDAGTAVEIYDYRGAEKGDLFGSGETTNGGAFEVELGSKFGDLLVEVGTSPARLAVVISGVESGDEVKDLIVSPYTTLATAYATYLVQNKERSVTDAYERSEKLIYEHFGDVRHASVAPEKPAGDVDSLTNGLLSGFLLVSLDREAQGMSQTAGLLDLVKLLAADIEYDGYFDGKSMGNLGLGDAELDGDTLRPNLAAQIRKYLDSPENETSFDSSDISQIIEKIATNNSEIFAGPPGVMDIERPTITITDPENGSVVSGVVSVKATATDNVEVKDIRVTAPQAVIDTNSDPDSLDAVLETYQFEDGELTITIEAEDQAGNTAEKSVTVTVRNNGILSGYVFKGFLKTANVTAYQFNPGGAEPMIASADTDEDGRYSMEIDSYEGPLLLVATSGYYTEEALGTEVELARGEYLSALVPDFTPAYSENVTLSPLTTWAAEYALNLVDSAGLNAAAAGTQANAEISAHFGNVDILNTLPVDLLAGAGCDTLTDRVLYSLYCAGLSQLAKNISEDSGLTPGAVVNAISMTMAVADDITDGTFNGRKGGGTLTQGGYDLSSYTVRTDLARSINEWLSSDMNPCAVSVTDFYDDANALAEDTADVFPENDPVIPVDEEGPEIVFTSHQDGEKVHGLVTIAAKAHDISGIAEFKIVEPVGTADNDGSVDGVSLTVNTDNFTDSVVVRLGATDNYGNDSVGTIELFIDRGGPTFDYEISSGSSVGDPSFTIRGTVTDSTGVSWLKIDGEVVEVQPDGSFVSRQYILVDGENTWEMRAADGLGNESFENYSIILDRVSPTILVGSPSDGQVFMFGQMVDVVAVASDTSGIRALTAKANGNLLEDTDSSPERVAVSIAADMLGEGPVALLFHAEDLAGNAAEKTVNIEIRNTIDVSGIVFKGPVTGATVRAYQWDSGVQGPELTDTTGVTNQSGAFSGVVRSTGGMILLKATGGSYKGEDRDDYANPVSLTGSDYLTALIDDSGTDVTNIALTPFSTLTVWLAQKLVADGYEPWAAYASAKQRIEAIFGFDLDTVPLNCREDTATGFNDSAKAGLLLAGLSRMGCRDFGDFNALELLRLIYQDFESDDVLDGKGFGGVQLQLGQVDLDSYVLRATLGRNVLHFLESTHNQSGLSTTNQSIVDWLNTIALSTDSIFDNSPEPIPVDIEKPSITFESHQNNDWVAGLIAVSVLGTDNDVAPAVEVTNITGLSTTSVQVDPKTTRLSFQLDTATIGQLLSYEIEFKATDRSGNVSIPTILTLRIDNQLPVVQWSSPADGVTIVTDAGQINCSGTVSDGSGVGMGTLTVNGVLATINGSSWSAVVPVEGDQYNNLNLAATDALGNETTLSRTVYINTDVVDPVITFNSHANNQWVNGTLEIIVQATDDRGLDSFVITSPPGLPASLQSGNPLLFILTVTGLDSTTAPDGNFPITYRAEDLAGNVTTRTLTLGIDNKPPALVWTNPTEGSSESSSSPGRVFASGDAPDVGCGLESVTINSGYSANVNGSSWTLMMTGLTTGPYTWHATAMDNLGNSVTEYVHFNFTLEP